MGHNCLVLRHRVAKQSKLLMELREDEVNIDAFRADLDDLFVDGDGLEQKAVSRIALGDLEEAFDRLRGFTIAGIKLAEFLLNASVFRICGDNFPVFLDRLVQLTFLNIFGRGFCDFIFVDGHSRCLFGGTPAYHRVIVVFSWAGCGKEARAAKGGRL